MHTILLLFIYLNHTKGHSKNIKKIHRDYSQVKVHVGPTREHYAQSQI